MRPDELIEVACRIGHRIRGQALADGATCTWQVEAFDVAAGTARSRPGGGELYQGTAGIALFLGELARVAGDAATARTALAGIRHSLAAAAALSPASFSFHSGRVGIAWAAARLAVALDRPELLPEATAVLAPLAGHEPSDQAFDVISGAAGAIPALLELRRALGREELLDVACRLGDRLIAAARREPGGWAWVTIGPAVSRPLAGLAHGASGIALALLELAFASGRGRYRFAAEMALLYERRLFDEERSNWPDLRHKELNDLVFSGDPDAARRAAVAGTVPPYRPLFMTAWCHGAPGIGLARVRALALTGQEIYRREAEAALAATLPGLRPPVRNNYSLCHGAAGNCELPLAASRVLDDPGLSAACDACAEYGWETYERAGRPWPCGTYLQATDPSLLLGEAGIGHFYLRLADPATAPVLLPEPAAAAGPAVEDGGFAELAQSWVEEEFGVTRRAFASLGVPPSEIATGGATPLADSPVEAAYRGLRGTVERARGRRRSLLQDAFAVERARHELSAVADDLAAAEVRRLRRQPAEAVDWRTAAFVLAGDVRLVTTHRDWHGRLDAETRGSAAEEGAAAWLVARQGDRLLTRRAGPLAALVAEALGSPARLAEIVERVASALEVGPGGDRRRLGERILEQLRALYRADLVDAVDGTQPAAHRRRDRFARGLQPPPQRPQPHFKESP